MPKLSAEQAVALQAQLPSDVGCLVLGTCLHTVKSHVEMHQAAITQKLDTLLEIESCGLVSIAMQAER